MDQIAAMGLQALAKYKEALDQAKEQVEVARQLSRRIEIFEVTITMIPSRGDKEQVKKMVESVPGQAFDESKLTGEDTSPGEDITTAGQIKKFGHDATEFVSSQIQGMVAEKVMELVSDSPLGGIADLIQSLGGEDSGPIIGKVRPADVLRKMKARGENDLTISFAAMSFIIHSALSIIDDAVKDVLKIGIPNIFWLVMPWKVMQQNEVGKNLAGHLEGLDKFNAQLQSAISIASYCVSLEQLENVLDATSMLINKSIREFWKKKIGISHVKISMNELRESYFNHIEKDIKAYKILSHHLKERIVNMRDVPEVALGRFLSNLWNGNGDEWLTVYELNMSTEKYGKDGDAMTLTAKKMFEIEKLFFKKIEFFPLLVDAGDDNIVGTADDELVCRDTHAIHAKHGVILHSNDIVLTINPFQRLTILCKIPRFNKDFYPHDCIAVMKYDKINSVRSLGNESIKANAEFCLQEVEGTRMYLSVEANEEMYQRDLYAWNAPASIMKKGRVKHEIKLPDDVVLSDNFVETLIDPSNTNEDEEEEDESEKKDQTGKFLDEGGITSTVHAMYTPTIRKPGVYTVRYVLDELSIDPHDDITSTAFKKKVALSQKNYYYNRSVDERAVITSTRGATICTTLDGLGFNNYKHYLDLTLQLLDLDIKEAIQQKDYPKLKFIYGEKEKFVKANVHKIEDFEEAAEKEKEKEAKEGKEEVAPVKESTAAKAAEREADLKAIKALLERHSVEASSTEEIDINFDQFLSKEIPSAAATAAVVAGGKGKAARRASGEKAIAAAIQPNVAAEESKVSEEKTETSNPPALSGIARESITDMYNNPLRTSPKRGGNTPPSRGSVSQNYYSQLATLSAFITKYLHDPMKIALEGSERRESFVRSSLADVAAMAAAAVVANSAPTDVHKRKPRILDTLAVDMYLNYVSSVLDDVESDKLSPEEIEFKKLILQKIIVLLKYTKLITGVEEYVNSNFKLWSDTLPFVNSALLQTTDNSLRELKGLISEHLLLRNTIKKAIEGSPVNPKDAHVLVDLHADEGDKYAKNCLIHDAQIQLFLQYYRIKVSIYTLDSKEAIENKDITRLQALADRMTALNDIMVKVSKGKIGNDLTQMASSATSEIYKTIMNTIIPSRETTKSERRRKKVYSKHVILFDTRETAARHIDTFLSNLSQFTEQLSEKVTSSLGRSQSVQITSSLKYKLERCLQIQKEFETIKTYTAFLHSLPRNHSEEKIYPLDGRVVGLDMAKIVENITIERVKVIAYAKYCSVIMQYLDLQIENIIKQDSTSVEMGTSTASSMKIQQLEEQKTTLIGSIKENLKRYESTGAGSFASEKIADRQKEAVKVITKLIGAHDESLSATDAVIAIKFNLLELPTTEGAVENPKAKKDAVKLISRVGKKSVAFKSTNSVLKVAKTLPEAFKQVIDEYQKHIKIVFPQTNADFRATPTANVSVDSIVHHLFQSFPRTTYDQVIDEVETSLKTWETPTNRSSEDWKKQTDELQKLFIIVSKMVLVLKLLKTIQDMDQEVIAEDCNTWLLALPQLNVIPLPTIANYIQAQDFLVTQYKTFIETIRFELSTSSRSVTNTSYLLDLDLSDDMDRYAKDSLIVKQQLTLFIRYYVLKMNLYGLDAQESSSVYDSHRVSVIERKINQLNEIFVRMIILNRKDEAVPVAPATSPSGAPDKAPNTGTANVNATAAALAASAAAGTITVKDIKKVLKEFLSTKSGFFTKLFLKLKDRSAARHDISIMLQDLERYVEELTRRLKLSTSTTAAGGNVQALSLSTNMAITNKIEFVKMIMKDLQDTINRANQLPPVDRTSLATLNGQEKEEIVRPHGLIINVENKNALVWGQVLKEWNTPSAFYWKKPEPVKEEEGTEEGGASSAATEGGNDEDNTGEEDEKIKWRPMIAFEYPYHTVYNMRVQKNHLVDDTSEDMIFGIFHHIVKSNADKKAAVQATVSTAVLKATSSGGDTETTTGASGGTGHVTTTTYVKTTPTHVAFYQRKDDAWGKHVTQITYADLQPHMFGKPYALSKAENAEYTEINLTKMFGRDQLTEEGIDENLELFLVFVSIAVTPVSKKDMATASATAASSHAHHHNVCHIVEGSPVLQFHVHDTHEDSDYDDDEDEDEEYDYGDDDEYDYGEYGGYEENGEDGEEGGESEGDGEGGEQDDEDDDE